MTSDQTLPQETKPDNTANFNGVNFLGQEIAEVEGRQKDLSEWLSRIEKAPNPHTIPSANAADKSGKIIGSFAGADSRFVEKDDVPELRKSSILLSIMVGLGTTAFTKYLILGSLTTSATISLSLISGVAAMAGFLYFFDRGLMQTLDRVKLQKSQEYKNFVSTLEADWKNFTTKIGKADAMGTLQSAAFGAGNAWANILMMGRLIIIGGSTAYLATAAADTFLVGSEVNADLQAQFDASQSVVDPNDGITTRPEVIADIKADSAEYSARISELETEKLALQKQLAGYELTPGEQQRLDVLNGQIAKLEAEKLAAEAKVAQFSAEMTKEAKGAAGAVEGEGPLWRKAKANLEYHERIAETKTTALTTAESQKKALIEGAQDRANSLRDDQFVTSNRARVTEIDQEINGLNAKITERADPEAFARKEGIWPEFNPEGNKRFMPVWEKVIEGGPQTMIISGMVITGAFIAEALAYLEKRGGELSKPVLKKAKYELYETFRREQIDALRSEIAACDVEIQALKDGDRSKRRSILQSAREDAHNVIKDGAAHSRAIVDALPKILAGEDTDALENLSEDDKIKAMELAETVRASAHQQAEIMVARAELETLMQKASLNAEAEKALSALSQSLQKAEQAASAHLTAAEGMHNHVIDVAQNAQTSLQTALATLGDDASTVPLKEALQRDFDLRMKALTDVVSQKGLKANDNRPGVGLPAVMALTAEKA